MRRKVRVAWRSSKATSRAATSQAPGSRDRWSASPASTRLTGKAAHRGNIWGVYVQPAARGRGVSRALLTEILSHARTQVKQVHLSVVTDNVAALALYERLGFTTYGTEPRSLFVDGRYLDEHLMVLHFD